MTSQGFPRWCTGKESTCQCRRCKTHLQSLGCEDPLEQEIEIHSSIPAWKIPRTEEPGGLQTMESQSVGHGWVRAHRHTTSQEICVCFKIFALFLTVLWNRIQDARMTGSYSRHTSFKKFRVNSPVETINIRIRVYTFCPDKWPIMTIFLVSFFQLIKIHR